MSDDRGQAYTLEGLVASIVVLTALLYGLQVVDVGPWTSDTSDQTRQLKTQAQDVLDLAANNGTLSAAVRCYGLDNKYAFDGDSLGNESRRTTFEVMLNQTFDERGREYNVYFYHWNETGGKELEVASANQSGAASGVVAPTDVAAVATRTIAVYDSEPTRINGSSEEDCADPGATVETQASSGNYYMRDIAPNSELFNIVEVRIVVW
jgi:hypothetical protein